MATKLANQPQAKPKPIITPSPQPTVYHEQRQRDAAPSFSINGNIILGLVLMAIGIIITVVSYSSASSTGGHYSIFWGLVAVGLYRLIMGVVQTLRG